MCEAQLAAFTFPVKLGEWEREREGGRGGGRLACKMEGNLLVAGSVNHNHPVMG